MKRRTKKEKRLRRLAKQRRKEMFGPPPLSDYQKKLRFMPYREYLLTPWWLSRRKVALKAAKYTCQSCGAKTSLQVHHKTYERLGKEKKEDLEVLCRRCHRERHRTFLEMSREMNRHLRSIQTE